MNLQFSMAGNVAAKPSDVRELVVELITELLHCSIPALHEIREEWPEDLKEQGASPKMIAFSEKLVDLVIEQKGNREAVSIEDIKIFPWFEETPPDPEKVKRKEEYFRRTGLLPSEIVLDREGSLLDGYISYLLLKKHGIKRVPVKYGKRQIIKAYHRPGGKLYTWELPGSLVDRVLPGDRVVVVANAGVRRVTVAAVEDYGGAECAGILKKAVRKIKNRITETK